MVFSECCLQEPYKEEAFGDRAAANNTQVGAGRGGGGGRKAGEGSVLPSFFSSLLGDMISPGETGLDLVTLKKC